MRSQQSSKPKSRLGASRRLEPLRRQQNKTGGTQCVPPVCFCRALRGRKPPDALADFSVRRANFHGACGAAAGLQLQAFAGHALRDQIRTRQGRLRSRSGDFVTALAIEYRTDDVIERRLIGRRQLGGLGNAEHPRTRGRNHRRRCRRGQRHGGTRHHRRHGDATTAVENRFGDDVELRRGWRVGCSGCGNRLRRDGRDGNGHRHRGPPFRHLQQHPAVQGGTHLLGQGRNRSGLGESHHRQCGFRFRGNGLGHRHRFWRWNNRFGHDRLWNGHRF